MNRERVAILFNEVTPESTLDERDVLLQVRVVSEALSGLGFRPVEVPFSLNLEKAVRTLKKIAPRFVFNLSEEVDHDERMIYLGASLLDHLKIPYSGCPTEAIFQASNKLAAKRILRSSGIATPEWASLSPVDPDPGPEGGMFLIKSVWDHASGWFDGDSVVRPSGAGELRETLLRRREKTGEESYAERYIDGREFNLAILAGTVLRIPEMEFVDYPDGKLNVVDYEAKWEENSFAYSHTLRRFEFPQRDRPLLEKLKAIAEQCWRVFGLRGYGRVDFRVDPNGTPLVLEINVNPCLSPDGGFHAAVRQSGLTMAEAVARIVADIPRLDPPGKE
jgi:D-alanine-D-alanine ligase